MFHCKTNPIHEADVSRAEAPESEMAEIYSGSPQVFTRKETEWCLLFFVQDGCPAFPRNLAHRN